MELYRAIFGNKKKIDSICFIMYNTIITKSKIFLAAQATGLLLNRCMTALCALLMDPYGGGI